MLGDDESPDLVNVNGLQAGDTWQPQWPKEQLWNWGFAGKALGQLGRID